MKLGEKTGKTVLISTLILLSAVLVAMVSLTLSFCLPNSSIATHVQSSLDIFNHEKDPVIENTTVTNLDNYTDELMLNSASYLPTSSISDKEYSTLDRALLIPRAYIKGSDQLIPMVQYFNGGEVETENYSRYWHGYMIYLRPLLLVFDYSLIRFLLFAIHISLCAIYLILLNKRCGNYPTIAFVTVYVITGSFIVPFSLQYTNVTTITLISGIVLINFYDSLAEKGLIQYLFLITGILTSFFDLLTFPLMSLGVNLCLLFLLDKNFNLKRMFVACAMWSFGYLGMWVGKWIVATALTFENVINDAVLQIFYRTGDRILNDFGEQLKQITYLDVLQRNIAHYSKKYIILPVLIIIIGRFAIKLRDNCKQLNFKRLLYLMFIIAIPFVWYFLVKNHSYDHSGFTFRTLCPAVIAVLLLPECMSKTVCSVSRLSRQRARIN